MAKLFKHDETLTVFTLTPVEAANLIAHLVAQMANTNLPNNQVGACYSVRTSDSERISFCVDTKTG
jgi:hypothetical protein